MVFQLYFQKVIQPGQGFIFDEKIFCKSQTSQNMPKFGWQHARSSNQTVPAKDLPYNQLETKNNLSAQDLKIQWEIPYFFLFFLLYRQKCSKKKSRTVIKSDFMRTFFRFDFGPGKVPHPKTCTFTFMHFPVGALSKVQN